VPGIYHFPRYRVVSEMMLRIVFLDTHHAQERLDVWLAGVASRAPPVRKRSNDASCAL
jgi:hypothetical protein